MSPWATKQSENTLVRVQERFYWFGMKHDIYNWTTSCVTCSLKKELNRLTDDH